MSNRRVFYIQINFMFNIDILLRYFFHNIALFHRFLPYFDVIPLWIFFFDFLWQTECDAEAMDAA